MKDTKVLNKELNCKIFKVTKKNNVKGAAKFSMNSFVQIGTAYKCLMFWYKHQLDENVK